MKRSALLAVLSLSVASPGCFLLCVAAGALISTPKGRRRIEQLRVGDAVFSVDVETGALVEVRVTHIRSATRECLALELLGGERLTCTPSHPIYDPESSTYRQAGEWVTGAATQIARVVEGKLLVQAVELSQAYAGLHEVFDISVEGPHHNFIADGIVVHNKTIDDSASGLPEFEGDSGDALPDWLEAIPETPCINPDGPGMCLTIEDREYLLTNSAASIDPATNLVVASFAPADSNSYPRVVMTFPSEGSSFDCDVEGVSVIADFETAIVESHPSGEALDCSLIVSSSAAPGKMLNGSFDGELGETLIDVYSADADFNELLIEE